MRQEKTMNRFLMLIVLILVWALPQAEAALPVLGEVVAAVQTPFRSDTPAPLRIRDYRADFVQESRIVSLNRMQQASGKVVVAFDRQEAEDSPEVLFRWEYLEPSRQLIVSDGTTVWVYVPENNQVIRTLAADLARNRENDPMTFLTGLSRLTRDFNVRWAEPKLTEEGHYRLELQPRQESALVARLLMTIDQQAVAAGQRQAQDAAAQRPVFPVLAATIIDLNGNRSDIHFEHIRVNTGTDPQTFVFQVPEGVDVMSPADAGLNF